ncbi:MAG: DNA translocase FtsK 4TM domain-containing protein [Paludibacteraceae bacterium]|nr:DNA translocase FtsK 4TM domain-containing protein [Paludibacteraceae bacterium]
MPRRTVTTRTNSRREADPIRVEQESFWQKVSQFIHDKRTHYVVGSIMVAMAVFLAIAYFSFFFTGSSDTSVLTGVDARGNRQEIQNVLGLPGALSAEKMINGSFGISSIALVMLLLVFGLKLLNVTKTSGTKWFFHTVFWLLWTSIVLGFAQTMFGLNHWFIQLGGSHGKWLSAWMNSYVYPLGMVLILLTVLVIYLIVIDRNFIEHVSHLWDRLVGLFRKEPKTEDLFGEPIPNDELTPTAEPTPAADQPTVVNFEQADDLVRVTAEPAETVEPLPLEDEDDVLVQVTAGADGEMPVVQIAPAHTEEDPDSAVVIVDEIVEKKPEVDPNAPKVDFEIAKVKDVAQVEDEQVDPLEKLGPYDPRKELSKYKFPGLDLLKVYDNESAPIINQEEQQENANRIVTTLRNYGIEIDSIKATVGPTVTLYEVVPKAGIRIAKIQNLENDIMMSLSATGIRIIAPMPGKGTVGIEVPNEKPQTVSMHSVLASKRFQEEKKMRLPVAIGRTITNEVFMFDLAKTPHLLVAGATGQGKSVAINAILTSLLYKKHPAELKMVLVDPKMVEFAPYKPLLRHYLAAMPETDPDKIIITDCAEVINTLNSLVIEMENRYKLLMDAGVRNLEDYNEKFINRRLNPDKPVADGLHHQYLPYIVIVIDEYGDFIMQVGKQVETPIARITQKARAVGMHMILATQRPSVNIVTGVIKANIPTRIALRTQSVIDSRTVLDAKGADQLIGRGDMLYSGNGNITRLQCAFVDTPEVDEIVKHIEAQQHYLQPYPLPEYVPEGAEGEALAPGSVDMKRLDPMFADVARYVVAKQEGSTSRLQRAFEIGYNRAGKLSDQLEAAGIVGPNKGPKGRDVLIVDMDQLEQLLEQLNVK